MKSLGFYAGVIAAAVLVQAAPGHAEIVGDPDAPRLDAAFCPPGSPANAGNPASSSGGIPAWRPAAGRPLVKYELRAPNAVCNDGSRAVVYARPAPASASLAMRNTWHIHLKGGGSCTGFNDCRDRWCRAPGGLNDPGLMSSDGTPDMAAGRGLFADHFSNPLRDANQILAAYCSSDQWIGDVGPAGMVSLDEKDTPDDVSAIQFRGAAIVRALLDELEQCIDITWTIDTPQSARLCLDGRTIVVSGDSAGAHGVRHHIDRIAKRFPTARVFGLLDAGGGVNLQDARVEFGNLPDTPNYADYMAELIDQKRAFHGVRDRALDATCKAEHPGTGVAEIPCFDPHLLTAEHIETPMLQRLSLADRAGIGLFARLGIIEWDKAVMASIAHDSLAAATAANARFSALGPNCERHVTFRNNPNFRQHFTLRGGDPLPVEIRDWLQSCFTGQCSQMVVLADPTDPDASSCR